MKLSPLRLFGLAAAIILAGCAAQTKEQIEAVRAAKVSSAVVAKLEHRGSLAPEDLIELKRRRVNDGVALRQLDRAGVDYVIDKTAVKRMQAAGVSDTVVEAAIMASDRFVGRFFDLGPPYGYGWYAWYGPPGYPYHPYFRDPWRPPGHPGFVYRHPRHR